MGAGLPVIATLKHLVDTGDRILKVEGIFSGTLSYIFNMFSQDKPFSDIVTEAKALGYTEPDPRDDLAGMDVARKVTILARYSFTLLTPLQWRSRKHIHLVCYVIACPAPCSIACTAWVNTVLARAAEPLHIESITCELSQQRMLQTEDSNIARGCRLLIQRHVAVETFISAALPRHQQSCNCQGNKNAGSTLELSAVAKQNLALLQQQTFLLAATSTHRLVCSRSAAVTAVWCLQGGWSESGAE